MSPEPLLPNCHLTTPSGLQFLFSELKLEFPPKKIFDFIYNNQRAQPLMLEDIKLLNSITTLDFTIKDDYGHTCAQALLR
jgi:hypothetical protein